MRRVVLVAALISGLIVGACGGDDDASENGDGAAATAEEIEIVHVPPSLENPVIAAIDEGLKVKAQELGMEVSTVGGRFDPQEQFSSVNAAAQQAPDALVTWPLDPNGIRPALDSVREDGGAELILFEAADVEPYLTNIDFNNTQAAAEIARYAAEQLEQEGEECRVGIIEGVEVVEVLRKRNEGLVQGAEEAGCEILERATNETDVTSGARPIVDAWRTQYGDEMTAVLAYNDPSALAVIAGRRGDFQPIVTGMNGDSDAVTEIEEGRMLATMGFPSVESGNAAGQLIYDHLVEGEEVPQNILARYEFISTENIDEYVTFEERLQQPMSISFSEEDGETVLQAE